MNRPTLAIIFILLCLNLLGTSYLLVSRCSPTTDVAFQRKVTEAKLAQIDKIMNLAVEFRWELEVLPQKLLIRRRSLKSKQVNIFRITE